MPTRPLSLEPQLANKDTISWHAYQSWPHGASFFIAARSLNEPVGGDTTGHSVFVFPFVGLAVLEFTVEKDLIGIGKGQLVE